MRPLIAGFFALVIAAVVGTASLSSGGPRPVDAVSADVAGVEERAASVVSADAVDVEPLPALSGPTEAALRAVVLNGELVTTGHFSRRDLLGSIATPELADALLADASTQIPDFQFEVDTSSDFEILQAPVTSRAEFVGPDRVEVSVWSVVVVSSSAFGVGRESWQSSRLEMVFRNDVWLVDVWETEPGPAPAPSADLVFAGPGELAEPMSWPAVVAAPVVG